MTAPWAARSFAAFPDVGELVDPVVPAGHLRGQVQPHIAHDGVELRPWSLDDVPLLTEAFRDPAIQQWHARTMNEAEARTWITERMGRWSREMGVDWAITVGSVGVGRVGFRELNLREGRFHRLELCSIRTDGTTCTCTRGWGRTSG